LLIAKFEPILNQTTLSDLVNFSLVKGSPKALTSDVVPRAVAVPVKGIIRLEVFRVEAPVVLVYPDLACSDPMNAINLGIGWYERPEGYRGNEFRWLIRSIGMGSGERLSRFVMQLAGKVLNFYFWTTK
jgi:hypothetical protein